MCINTYIRLKYALLIILLSNFILETSAAVRASPCCCGCCAPPKPQRSFCPCKRKAKLKEVICPYQRNLGKYAEVHGPECCCEPPKENIKPCCSCPKKKVMSPCDELHRLFT